MSSILPPIDSVLPHNLIYQDRYEKKSSIHIYYLDSAILEQASICIKPSSSGIRDFIDQTQAVSSFMHLVNIIENHWYMIKFIWDQPKFLYHELNILSFGSSKFGVSLLYYKNYLVYRNPEDPLSRFSFLWKFPIKESLLFLLFVNFVPPGNKQLFLLIKSWLTFRVMFPNIKQVKLTVIFSNTVQNLENPPLFYFILIPICFMTNTCL